MTILVYVAIGYGARLTYDEHVRQLAAETGTMAATVVVYVNRNLDTADAVAATASRHPSMRALSQSAATEVLSPLMTPNGLLHNALMADAEGRVLVWAQPPVIRRHSRRHRRSKDWGYRQAARHRAL